MAATFTFTLSVAAYGDKGVGPIKQVKNVAAQTTADTVPVAATSGWFTVPMLGQNGMNNVKFFVSTLTKNNTDNTLDADLYMLSDRDADGTDEVTFVKENLFQIASGETLEDAVEETNLAPGKYYVQILNFAGT